MLSDENKRRYFIRLALVGALIACIMALRENDHNGFWIILLGFIGFYLDRQVIKDEEN